MKLTKQQEERFVKIFQDSDYVDDRGDLWCVDGYVYKEKLETFINNELSLQLSEIIQIAEERYKTYSNKYKKLPSTYEEGCMDALDNLISTLTTLQEKHDRQML